VIAIYAIFDFILVFYKNRNYLLRKLPAKLAETSNITHLQYQVKKENDVRILTSKNTDMS